MNYRVVITSSAQREIGKLPQDMGDRIIARILSLKQNPRPYGVIKMKGRESYRLRVGDYRVIYTVEDTVKIVTVTDVGHRREVYH